MRIAALPCLVPRVAARTESACVASVGVVPATADTTAVIPAMQRTTPCSKSRWRKKKDSKLHQESVQTSALTTACALTASACARLATQALTVPWWTWATTRVRMDVVLSVVRKHREEDVGLVNVFATLVSKDPTVRKC